MTVGGGKVLSVPEAAQQKLVVVVIDDNLKIGDACVRSDRTKVEEAVTQNLKTWNIVFPERKERGSWSRGYMQRNECKYMYDAS